ncbi:Golgi transport complex subunit COG2 Ecym_4435 [Eremothecium cymbalariae DBVPG|uniref:Conserved oligomeric Golgi complex subunit 2 n=1 Tax=Eremothecium cymbalariae (strain CBS 270.75 / DBVPG 7215 / KCTC 17166 / NRRL Y-17582) TaxID=931890 RepID=G8JTX8_ERECY|nr:hypothetical protein Ecym_4435 [Eremothecium cymbalariae DBVPG\
MDDLFEDLELPVVREINRALFADALTDQGKEFDVNHFLLSNNLHYVSIDELSKHLKSLEQELNNALIDDVNESYLEFCSLCEEFSKKEDSHILSNIQQVRYDLARFNTTLKTLVTTDLQNTKETVTDTVEYLKSLDGLNILLQRHGIIHSCFQLVQKLCQSLDAMSTDAIDIDDELGALLLSELDKLLRCSHSILLELQGLGSPLMKRFNNDYHSVLQNFHSIVSILTDKCALNSKKYPKITQTLLSMLNK